MAALLDPLTYRCHIFEMNAESYRLREWMKGKRAKAAAEPSARDANTDATNGKFSGNPGSTRTSAAARSGKGSRGPPISQATHTDYVDPNLTPSGAPITRGSPAR